MCGCVPFLRLLFCAPFGRHMKNCRLKFVSCFCILHNVGRSHYRDPDRYISRGFDCAIYGRLFEFDLSDCCSMFQTELEICLYHLSFCSTDGVLYVINSCTVSSPGSKKYEISIEVYVTRLYMVSSQDVQVHLVLCISHLFLRHVVRSDGSR